MVRSMYSGVAGMRANQNRMDVIGNNIANSNTYGFKSSRATFRDIYYQTYRGASEGTQTRGGINPSAIGYGAQLASIDLMMDSSSMTSTGFALDCAITGDGFFQVMDPDGNIYFTKAGMLDIDQATGALIDSNGNFVLGTSATDGKLDSSKPGQNKIIIALDAVPASTASVQQEIGGRTLFITSQNQNKDANVSFTFSKSSEMPDGMRVRVVREGTSSVFNVQLNAYAEFRDMDDLAAEINNAITQNYGGTHPGGTYDFKMVPDPFDELGGPLTGANLVDTPTVEFEGGNLEITDPTKFPSGFRLDQEHINQLGLTFAGVGEFKLTPKWDDEKGELTVTMEGVDENNQSVTYVGTITLDRLEASSAGGSVMLKREPLNPNDPTDYIVIGYGGRGMLLEEDPNATATGKGFKLKNLDPTGGTAEFFTGITATAMAPTKKCGWGKATFTLTGGTEFHTQSVSDITGISVGADGLITGTTENGLTTLGRIDLATFGNPKGMEQIGSSYFAETVASGPAKLAIAGESGTGAIKNSALEMSNVDLAQEFSDMIVTQRGFQASSRMITVSDTMLEELTNLKR